MSIPVAVRTQALAVELARPYARLARGIGALVTPPAPCWAEREGPDQPCLCCGR